VYRHELRHAAPTQVGPNGLEFRPVRQQFPNLDCRIGHGTRAFNQQPAIRKPCHGLPLHYTPFFKTFGRVFAHQVPILGNESPDCLEQLAHKQL
jgi:hypothetical protein